MGIDRKSSIEREPMTLKLTQIKYAREAALRVLNTKTTEEAMTIFTQGLEPVVCGAAAAEGESKTVENSTQHFYCEEEHHQLRYLHRFKDVFSSPF